MDDQASERRASEPKASERQGSLTDLMVREATARGITVEELSDEVRDALAERYFGGKWSGFQLIGASRRSDPIIVVDYDPAWPKHFAVWQQRIQSALGEHARRIEHVGSTSVVGLAAKPIIDIQVSLVDLNDEDGYVPQLAAHKFELRSRDVEHRYFRPIVGEPRTVQVHVCQVDTRWERDHLRFRDYLRNHPEARDRYAALKRDLATRFRGDRLRYTDGKSGLIREILALEALASCESGDVEAT